MRWILALSPFALTFLLMYGGKPVWDDDPDRNTRVLRRVPFVFAALAAISLLLLATMPAEKRPFGMAVVGLNLVFLIVSATVARPRGASGPKGASRTSADDAV